MDDNNWMLNNRIPNDLIVSAKLLKHTKQSHRIV